MYAASTPVADAVFALLQDATLQAALVGGLHGDVPQNPDYPFQWYEIFDELEKRGFGTGSLPEMELRIHTFSQYGGMAEAREVNRLAIAVLRDAALTIDGYTQCGRVTWRETVSLPDEELNGVKVHELVSIFTIWAEENAA